MYKFIALTCFLSQMCMAQTLKPGFDKNEYRELLYVSARTTADSSYFKKIHEPERFQMIYQSTPMGLDNLWDLWVDENGNAAISIRGTTSKSESWLANAYAAMVPAKGEIKLSKDEKFVYQLADNPRAAVHTGWLLSLAFLSKDILPRVDSLFKSGVKDFLIIGHSQGGAIVYLLTAYLYHMQKSGKLAKEIRFKTYCSAAPKPGNLFFAYDYESMTAGGWAFNVVNAADWVPEVPISIQTLEDFNKINPFVNAKSVIKKQKFPKNLVLKSIYNQLERPAKKAHKRYKKYLGKMTSRLIGKYLVEFTPPAYYQSSDYVRTGTTIVMIADDDYFKEFPVNNPAQIFRHHLFEQYLFLLEGLPGTTDK